MSTTNIIRRRSFLAATLAAAAAGAAGCGFSGDNDDSGDDSNSTNGTGENGDDGGGEPQRGGTLLQSMLPVAQFDPAVAGNASYGQIMMNGLWERLVNIDENDLTQVAPGVAESWDVSEDLLTYTFHLRDNALWSNGDPVTAQDFEWNFQRVVTPGIAGEANPSFNNNRIFMVGATEYQTEQTDDFSEVGFTAVDDATIEIVLQRPNPNLLTILGYLSWPLPLHPATVEEHGDGWADPANWVSNGAYVLDSFRVNDGAVLLPNDQYWDADNYYLDRWEISFNDAGTPADLVSYQSNEIHITGRIEDNLEDVTTSDVADELMTSPPNQYRRLSVLNSAHPALHDINVRKALSLAIDREALAQAAVPAVPGPTHVPAGVPGYEQIPGVEFNLEEARSLLADAGYPDGDGMPVLHLLDLQQSSWVEAIAQMWADNLGVDARPDVVEIGVYGARREELLTDYHGFIVINNAVNPPTMLSTAQLPSGNPRRVFEDRNLAPFEVAEELYAAVQDGAAPPDLLEILDGRRHPEIENEIELVRAALAEEDPDAQAPLLVEAAIAHEEAFHSIPVLWGGYNLLIKPEVQNLKLWNFPHVFTTKGVYLEE